MNTGKYELKEFKSFQPTLLQLNRLQFQPHLLWEWNTSLCLGGNTWMGIELVDKPRARYLNKQRVIEAELKFAQSGHRKHRILKNKLTTSRLLANESWLHAHAMQDLCIVAKTEHLELKTIQSNWITDGTRWVYLHRQMQVILQQENRYHSLMMWVRHRTTVGLCQMHPV